MKVLTGDMFESRAQTLVNTVNCVGVMGKGIALEFKKRFPEMFEDYAKRCRKGEVKLGRPYLYRSSSGSWILNFPTKDHWRSVTRLKDIISGLEFLAQHYKEWDIKSLAVPPLGCGHGQLEWRIVGPTLYRYLERLDIPVELYAPYGTAHEELETEFFRQKELFPDARKKMPGPEWVNPGWVGLVDILRRIEEQPFHWPVGRTIFQKMAYVATQEGLPTGFQYRKSSYGPYSSELKNVITRLLNNGLIREERLGRMFHVKVGPTFQDAQKAYKNELNQWEPILDKTADLFMRMNTNQAEIVATVLFAHAMVQNQFKEKPSEKDVMNAVLQWKERRRPKLDEAELALTVRNLTALGWIQAKASPDLPIREEAFLDG